VWGVVGGLCALTSPVVGFVWGIMTLAGGWRRGARSRFAVAALAAGLTVAPWVVRNYLVFGRFIPVKSNLAYELYQSQCLQPRGILQGFPGHPYGSSGPERREYKRVGEMAYLDRKWGLFYEALEADPLDFVRRVGNRFLAATVEYVPFNRDEKIRYPWKFWLTRVTYPLPFACLLFLLAMAPWRPLAPAQWIVIGAYLLYLFPYVIISFYDRYKFPVLAAEAAFIVWGIDRIRLIVGQWTAADAELEAVEVVEEEPEAEQFISFACPECAQSLKARPHLAGEKIKCPRCEKPAMVPDPGLPHPGVNGQQNGEHRKAPGIIGERHDGSGRIASKPERVKRGGLS
jgi:hypothetical protein